MCTSRSKSQLNTATPWVKVLWAPACSPYLLHIPFTVYNLFCRSTGRLLFWVTQIYPEHSRNQLGTHVQLEDWYEFTETCSMLGLLFSHMHSVTGKVTYRFLVPQAVLTSATTPGNLLSWSVFFEVMIDSAWFSQAGRNMQRNLSNPDVQGQVSTGYWLRWQQLEMTAVCLLFLGSASSILSYELFKMMYRSLPAMTI